MTKTEAINEAVDLLKDEANELALMMSGSSFYNQLPHRGKVAIRREMERLRLIAETLEPTKVA